MNERLMVKSMLNIMKMLIRTLKKLCCSYDVQLMFLHVCIYINNIAKQTLFEEAQAILIYQNDEFMETDTNNIAN